MCDMTYINQSCISTHLSYAYNLLKSVIVVCMYIHPYWLNLDFGYNFLVVYYHVAACIYYVVRILYILMIICICISCECRNRQYLIKCIEIPAFAGMTVREAYVRILYKSHLLYRKEISFSVCGLLELWGLVSGLFLPPRLPRRVFFLAGSPVAGSIGLVVC